jgi:hypothetical protein
MPMDPKLAALYGTAQVDESDVEKLAAAKLAEDLAGDEQVEVSEMTDEQVEALAQSLLAEEAEEAKVEEPAEKTSAAEEKVEEKDEAQEKLAEADYLGRVMAHAYVQELAKIAAAQEVTEKTAGKGKVQAFLKNPKKMGKEKKAEEEVAEVKEPEAKPSALDVLAERRALEILKENGIDPTAEVKEEKAEEAVTEPTVKTSASEQEMQTLANAVEQRAFEILKANGYVQEETEEKVEETK